LNPSFAELYDGAQYRCVCRSISSSDGCAISSAKFDSIIDSSKRHAPSRYRAAASSNALLVQQYLNTLSLVESPLSVLSSFMQLGYCSVQLTLCNFLGACEQSSVLVLVTSSVVPTAVTIFGYPLTTLSRSNPLSLLADTHMSTCGAASISRADLLYSWSISRDGAVLSSVNSYSKMSYTHK
jgi:hypothetical protein